MSLRPCFCTRTIESSTLLRVRRSLVWNASCRPMCSAGMCGAVKPSAETVASRHGSPEGARRKSRHLLQEVARLSLSWCTSSLGQPWPPKGLWAWVALLELFEVALLENHSGFHLWESRDEHASGVSV